MLFSFLCGSLQSQEWQNLLFTNIITYNSYVLKIRPIVYSPHSDVYAAHIMAGKRIFKPLTVVAFWKNDTRHKHRLGFRADLQFQFFNEKLTPSMQIRYFWGLNSTTANQYYLIPSIDYKIHPSIKIGAWCFGTSEVNAQFMAFCGPTCTVSLTKWMFLFASYTWDLNSTKHLLYVEYYLKYNIKSKKNKETQ
jgi:hypothetical protein